MEEEHIDIKLGINDHFTPVRYNQSAYKLDILEKKCKTKNKSLIKNGAIPLVFVSYSYDGSAHENWVKKLVCDLVNAGIAVIYDQWQKKLGELFTDFMEKSVNKADRVVCVLTTKYKKKTQGKTCGVKKEYSVISDKILKNRRTSKYIPAIKSGKDKDVMPPKLKGRVYVDFRCKKQYDKSLKELINDIKDNTKIKKR